MGNRWLLMIPTNRIIRIIISTGGLKPSEKWWTSSVGMMIFPNILWKITFMFQTTNQYNIYIIYRLIVSPIPMGYPMFRSTLPLGTAPLTVKTKTGVVIEPPFWWKPNFKPLDPTLGSTRDTNSVLLPSRWFFEFGSQALAPGESLFPFFWNVHILRGSITHFQPFPDIVKWGLFIVKSQWLMVKSPFFHRCRLWKNAIFHNPNPNIYTYIYIYPNHWLNIH